MWKLFKATAMKPVQVVDGGMSIPVTPYSDGMVMQANAEPDLAQTGERLRPVMASLNQGILNLVLPALLAGDPSLQVDMMHCKLQSSLGGCICQGVMKCMARNSTGTSSHRL